MWTSTKLTAGTIRRPIEETLEALHDVVKSGKVRLHRRFVHVRLAIHQSALSRRSSRLDPLYLHAESLQPALSRRRTRNDSPLRIRRHRVIPWSPLARGRLARPWQGESTKRHETDQFSKKLYSRTEEADRKVIDRLGQVSEQRGVSRATACACVAARQAGSYCANCRRHQAAPSSDAVAAALAAPESRRGRCS